MDGLKPAAPQLPQTNPAPTPKFKPPQPTPGFKSPSTVTQPSQPFTPTTPQNSQPSSAGGYGQSSFQAAPAPTQASSSNAFARPSNQHITPQEPPQNIAPAPAPANEPVADRDLESLRGGDLLSDKAKAVPRKKTVPKPIYAVPVIAGIGVGTSFLDGAQLSTVYAIIMAVIVLLSVGLLFRIAAIRKVAVWTMFATAGICVLLSGLLYLQSSQADSKKESFTSEALRLNEINPQKSKEDQEKLDTMQKDMEAAQEKVGNNQNLFYARSIASAVIFAGIGVYLTRPKVKEAFEK